MKVKKASEGGAEQAGCWLEGTLAGWVAWAHGGWSAGRGDRGLDKGPAVPVLPKAFVRALERTVGTTASALGRTRSPWKGHG